MKNTHFFKGLIFTLLVSNPIWTYAQLGVGATNFTPNIGAMLDVSSTNKGVLLPRIASTASMIAPTDGLLFYNTTAKKFNYYDGAAWQQTYLGSQWNVNGSNISYSAGNVGIGTNSPSAKLTIFQNSLNLTPNINLSNVGNSSSVSPSNSSIFIDNTTLYTTSSNVGISAKVANGDFNNIAFLGVAQQAVNGHFATTSIAYTNTTEAFGVRATASKFGDANNAYSIFGNGFFGGWAGYFSGKVTITGTLTNPSDEKLKRNMRAMAEKESILTKLLKLNPIEYNFDEKSIKQMNLPPTKQFGFTAQNIEAQFPELVSISHHPAPDNAETDEEKKGIDYKAVNYIQLIPILTKAIQEQQEQIAKLQKQVEMLLKR
jgi:hypothetical protein